MAPAPAVLCDYQTKSRVRCLREQQNRPDPPLVPKHMSLQRKRWSFLSIGSRFCRFGNDKEARGQLSHALPFPNRPRGPVVESLCEYGAIGMDMGHMVLSHVVGAGFGSDVFFAGQSDGEE